MHMKSEEHGDKKKQTIAYSEKKFFALLLPAFYQSPSRLLAQKYFLFQFIQQPKDIWVSRLFYINDSTEI